MEHSQVFRSRRGFTLISVLMASGIMAILALALAQIMNRGQSMQQYISDRSDFQSVENMINLMSSQPEWCSQSFRDGASPPAVVSLAPLLVDPNAVIEVENIQMGANPVLWRNQNVGSRFTINDIELAGLGGGRIDEGATSIFPVRVVVRAQAVAGGSGGPSQNLSTENGAVIVGMRVDEATGGIVDCLPMNAQGCPVDTMLVSDGAGGEECASLDEIIGGYSCPAAAPGQPQLVLIGWTSTGAPNCVPPNPGAGLPPMQNVPLPRDRGICQSGAGRAATRASRCTAECTSIGYQDASVASCGAGVVNCQCSNPMTSRPPRTVTQTETGDCTTVDADARASSCRSACSVMGYPTASAGACTATAGGRRRAGRASFPCTCT